MIKIILKVTVFAVAFGFVEASVVVYLRELLGFGFYAPLTREEVLFLVPGIAFLEPETAVKIIRDTALLNVERMREAATIVMLTAVALLAGRKLRERIAFFFLAFGIWDIFYYLFLRLTVGWPKTLGDFDIFFLLPTPWVGPVFVPIIVSFVLVITSMVLLLRGRRK